MARRKKSVNKTNLEVTIRRFSQAKEDQQFVLADGRLLKDLMELADALEHMSEDVFKHHVNDAKNDFSLWTESVLHEPELAEDLSKMSQQMDAQLTVLKHIAKKAF